MTPYRLSSGGLIDRSKSLSFSFDGKAMQGFEGDSLASALLANGRLLVGRSFKYHRPRGILTAGAAEPNALMTIGEGGRTEPNTRATMQELYDGLQAMSQNRWPSLDLDLGALNSLLSPFLGAGFYYKTFMWPAALWEKLYEPFIRRAAGLGRAGTVPDKARYERMNAFCDVLVVGAGPAGLTAAKAAAEKGARVVLADLESRLGGSANWSGETIDGMPARMSIDTGSRSSLTMHSPFVREHTLVEKYHAAPDAVIGWGVGGPSRGRPARLGMLKLGDLEIPGIAGDLYTGDKGSFANPDLAGNLGGGVFKRFTVAFDYANKRLYFKPNAGYGKPDAFDRSGFFLLADQDALVVADVAADSAAAKAGFAPDDRIVAIDGAPADRKSLVAWRAKLRDLPVGTKLKVERMHGGTKETVELVLMDRIPAA